MKCGDIILVSFPFTDDSAAKVRPALVVSADSFNTGEDIVVVPISSVAETSGAFTLPIPQSSEHFRQSGLRRSSHVKWTKLLTITRRMAQRRLGRLAPPLLSEVHTRIRSMFPA
jgi:mRNA interferase MazF